MLGRDQSVNLSGMLGQIAETTGSMGDAYKPVLKEGTKPRGDMNDPKHLERLAQWATTHGDSAAAAMYMSQAREAKAEQKEQKSMEHMAMSDKATMTGDLTAQQIAAQGDVTNLDRSIAALRERLAGEFPSVQARNYTKQNLEKLESLRSGAVQQQNKNQAQAITKIDTALADESLDPTAATALRDRKEQLLKNPEVQEALNAQKLEAFRAKQAQDAMEEDAYLQKHMPALQAAVSDPEEANRIISEAPAGMQDSLRQSFNSMKTFQNSIDEQAALFEEVGNPYQMERAEVQVNEVPKEFRAKPLATLEALRSAEARRDSNGDPLTEADAIAIRKARKAHTDAMTAAANAVGAQEYGIRRREERETEAEVEGLRNSIEDYRPSDDEVRTRARLLAEEDQNYIKVGADKKGKGGRTELNVGAYLQEARAQRIQENRQDAEAAIARLTGETPEMREFTEAEEARIQEGVKATGKTREEVIEYLDRIDGWSPKLTQVTVPDRETKEVPMRLADRADPLEMNRDPLITFDTAQSNYDRFLTNMANRRG